MKFTIELEEFWMDEDSEEVEVEIKKHIIYEVTKKIEASIADKVNEQITKNVEEFIQARLSVIINDEMAKCMDNGVIQPRGTVSEISITDHVKARFLESSGWQNPNKHIDQIAKEFGNELKLQYNNAFANKIVQNMKEQGLLKDEVVQILLGGYDK
jgi:DNA-binding transcriptional regulator YhcF (GntR family)